MPRCSSTGRPRQVTMNLMITLLLSVAAGGSSASPPVANPLEAGEIRVQVDPRIELCSIIFRIAGYEEYNQGRIESYLRDIDEHFQPSNDHEVFDIARSLRSERGIGFDACMSLALHLADGVDVLPAVSLSNESLTLFDDGRWTPDTANKFIDAARDFAQQTGFEDFFAAHADLYQHTQSALRRLVDGHMHVEWFERFYGVAPEAPFTIIPGLVNGPANYGPRFVGPDGDELLYAILGVWQSDEEGLPQFDESVLSTVVHEFNHSFVNHVVAAHVDELAEAGEQIQQAVGDAMSRMAYNNWKTVIDESLVRAAVVRYLRAYADEATVQAEIERQVERSFLWMPELEQLLGEYESSRERYPTFADFMPRVVAFFGEYAPSLASIVEQRKRELDARRPLIASITPPVGATDVDVTLTEIVITFDRPMRNGYQCMTSDRGVFPDGGGLRWNDDHTVLVMNVTLAPSTSYAFALNTEQGGAFRSAKGNAPLKRTEIWFRTGDR